MSLTIVAGATALASARTGPLTRRCRLRRRVLRHQRGRRGGHLGRLPPGPLGDRLRVRRRQVLSAWVDVAGHPAPRPRRGAARRPTDERRPARRDRARRARGRRGARRDRRALAGADTRRRRPRARPTRPEPSAPRSTRSTRSASRRSPTASASRRGPAACRAGCASASSSRRSARPIRACRAAFSHGAAVLRGARWATASTVRAPPRRWRSGASRSPPATVRGECAVADAVIDLSWTPDGWRVDERRRVRPGPSRRRRYAGSRPRPPASGASPCSVGS